MNPSSLATCRRCRGCQTRSWQPGSAAASVPAPGPGWGGVSGFLENIAEIWSTVTVTVRTLVWLVDTLPHPPPPLVFPSPSGARCLLSAVSQGSSSGVIDSSSQARPGQTKPVPGPRCYTQPSSAVTCSPSVSESQIRNSQHP